MVDGALRWIIVIVKNVIVTVAVCAVAVVNK
jgi:hypothetical protein